MAANMSSAAHLFLRLAFVAAISFGWLLFSESVNAQEPRKPAWPKSIALDFEQEHLGEGSWEPERCLNSDRYDDCGGYFTEMGIVAPPGFRSTIQLHASPTLSITSYSRTEKDPGELRAVVNDPSGKRNRVLQISSPDHNDATILRSTLPLPSRYKICVDIGYVDFGSGKSGTLNGYVGGEKALPWLAMDATLENGVYWLTIMDTQPYPRNNVWIHHHRKIVVDCDNNRAAWTEIWNGQAFVNDGRHPLTMFALSKNGPDDPRIGNPFIPFAAGELQPEGTVRAVDSYLDNEWYHVCITKDSNQYSVLVSGNFLYGGSTSYNFSVPLDRVRHALNHPDYFMLGDPHINFYRGKALYDNLSFESLAPDPSGPPALQVKKVY